MKPETTRHSHKTVQLEKIYSHPPGRVWQALTDPQALAQWLLPNSFRPHLGHRFRFTRRADGGKPEKVQCQVVELEAPRRLAYTWQAESDDAPTLVTWTLEPVEEGTRLRLEHIGPTTACAFSGGISSAVDRFGDFLQVGLILLRPQEGAGYRERTRLGGAARQASSRTRIQGDVRSRRTRRKEVLPCNR